MTSSLLSSVSQVISKDGDEPMRITVHAFEDGRITAWLESAGVPQEVDPERLMTLVEVIVMGIGSFLDPEWKGEPIPTGPVDISNISRFDLERMSGQHDR